MIEFTKKEVEDLRYERYHHPHPRVQMRMEALYLKSKGFAHGVICDIVGICPNTLRAYFQLFLKGGIEKLKELNFRRPESELANHRSSIEQFFKEIPPASVKEAVSEIEKLTGIKRSNTQVQKFMKRIGMKRLKIGAIPGKADVDAQEEFIKKKLQPEIDDAKKGKSRLFYVDAHCTGQFLSR